MLTASADPGNHPPVALRPGFVIMDARWMIRAIGCQWLLEQP
jgi:hypothetical protein